MVRRKGDTPNTGLRAIFIISTYLDDITAGRDSAADCGKQLKDPRHGFRTFCSFLRKTND